ncbi:MAG: thioredoxin family protein [Pirellulaceae bacterium]
MRSPLRPLTTLALLLALLAAPTFALAQPGGVPSFEPPGGLGDLPGIGLGLGDSAETVITAEFEAQEGGREGRLKVTADVPPDWHIYSTTQPKDSTGFPTKIRLDDGAPLEIVGPFQADRDPHLVTIEGKPAKSEEFEGQVVWTAPVKFAAGVDPAQAKFDIKFDALVCRGGPEGACKPVFEKLTATYAGTYKAIVPTGEYRDGLSHLTLRGYLEPAVAAPGDTVKLVITAVPDEKYHVYALSDRDPEEINKPTLISLQKLSGLTAGKPLADHPPIEKETGVKEQPITRYYEKPVSWTVDLKVPSDAKAGEYPIAGGVGYQTCLETNCDPNAAKFAATLAVAEKAESGQLPLAFSPWKYVEAAEIAETTAAQAESKRAEPINAATLGLYVLFGLLGGLILNAMPCVLPVIGLKIMSFAQQGGQDRFRVLSLNLWYSIGIIAVFLILATLAAFLNLGWGEQFTYTWFKVAMIGLVFAMALSFLGVWEIPIPGFVGGSQASALQSQEGATGAFFKGVFTTVLATPCSGPFLGPVFGLTLSQPAYVTYVLFASVGVGMSSPYLLIGAFPELVRFVPRPGAWMDTFKQLMGFVLLATVVFLFSTVAADYFIPTLTLLVGLWFACWLIGRLPATAESGQKLRRWAAAATICAIAGMFGFKALGPSDHELPWQPYSPTALAAARADGKTVVVDFTANWCLTCKTNLKFSINTPKVHELVEKNEVVPLLADWTDRNDEIKRKLAELNSTSIPVFAVYPAGKPDEAVIILRDLVSESQIVEAIEKAGPSQEQVDETATAMNN